MSNEKPNTRVMTPEFRASYAHVLKAVTNDLNGELEYSLVMLFDKSADLTAMKAACNAAITAKWGANVPKGLRSPFRDGDEKESPAYKGKVFCTAKSKERPGVVDEDVQPIISEEGFYSGCYARATVNAFAYDNKGNRGVSFFLCNVQKTKEGERIGGGKPANEDFQPVKRQAPENFLEADDFAKHVLADKPSGEVPF